MKNPEIQIETERKPHNPPCKFLRSKEMFHEDAAGEEGEFASDVFWCSKSQEAFGLDGEPAGKCDCTNARKCYDPL